MTPRSSGPGGEYAPLRGTTNLRLTANQHCKCNGKLRWRSCGHHFPSQPGRGSATDCLGHSRKADLVNFSQAPKLHVRLLRFSAPAHTFEARASGCAQILQFPDLLLDTHELLVEEFFNM